MKKTLDEFKKVLPEGFFYISGFDKGMQSRIKVKNNITGKIHNIKAENYSYLNLTSKRISERLIREECAKRGYKFINKDKKKIFLEYLGKKYSIYTNNFMNGMDPKEISVIKTSIKKIDTSKKKFIETSIRDDINDYEILEFSGMKKFMKIKHKPTETIHLIPNPQIFSKGGYRDFPWDVEKKRLILEKDFIEKFNKIVDRDHYDLGHTFKYINNKTKINIMHKDCSNSFEVRPDFFLNQGTRCPFCALKGKSNQEAELLGFVESIYFNTIRHNYKLGDIELDIYLPDLKIAIEYNGLYWHSEKNGKDKNYHLNKTNRCRENDIRLIHIFEDEWVNKNEITKAKLKHILKLNDSEKIYARKCIINVISSTKDKNKFLEENHIQGTDKSSIILGLYYDKLLVSIMTFSRPRSGIGRNTGKRNIYELVRFASIKDKIVIGAFGKLLKYFIEAYEFDTIITYADLRWSIDSNMYQKLGFVLKNQSKPSYWYTDRTNRYHRYNFRKQLLQEKFPKLYDSSLTEFEIMNQTDYNRVWDCGNLVYELKRNSK